MSDFRIHDHVDRSIKWHRKMNGYELIQKVRALEPEQGGRSLEETILDGPVQGNADTSSNAAALIAYSMQIIPGLLTKRIKDSLKPPVCCLRS